MANTALRDTLIGGYLAVKGLSIINKQSKTITVIKKWQQLWVVLGQAKAQWVLAIYQDRTNWMQSQKPLTIYQFVQLHSFTDKQTYDGLHMFLLKFAGGHKISFACGTQKQKSEWLTAVQKALNACYNKKQQKESHRSVTDDDWWQLSEHQENTAEFKEFQVALSSCSLTGNINRCRLCLYQSCIEVYGYSTYSSYTVRWTWQYTQLYCISFDKETLTLTIQLYISDQLEEICLTGKEALHLYNVLCNVSGVWDCTAQKSKPISADISPTLVRLEESDYTSVGIFLPDYLVQKMEDWYLVELVYCQHQPQLLGQYEVQLSLTHLHLKGCNCPHSWSWELHHIKSYSLDADQYLIIEVEGTSDVRSGMFHFGSDGSHNGHITTLYQLLQQLMVKLYLVVMIKQQLIVTQKQLSALMSSNQPLHKAIECFSCELLEGPSQDLLGHYRLQIFVDQIHVISNSAKWVWLLTEVYSYKLDQEEVEGATYVTIQISNSASAMIEEWVWSGSHMIRFYSFLLELCRLLSQQTCQEILISQVVTIRLMTSQTVTINTYTIQLTKEELVLIDADNQQVVSSYPLECIKRLNFDEGKNELIICTGESPALQPSELVIATDNAQELMLLINKAVHNRQQSFNAQLKTSQLSLDSHQSQLDAQLLSNNYREVVHQVSDKQATIKTQEAEYRIPTDVDSSHQRAQRRLISAHQIPADDQQVSVKTMHWYPIETDHTLTNTIDTVHRTNWDSSHQPQIVPTKQEIVQTCEIKHQTPDNTDKQVTPQVAESKQQVLTKTHKIEYHSSSDFPQIQENIHQPLHETQLQSQEVAENKQQVMIKAVPEQPQAQIQYMLLKSQQVSIKRETSSQPSLEAQLLQVPNQNAYEPLVKIDEATHEIQHIVTEDEEQGYTLTEPRHLMQQTLTDTQVSVGTQQITKPTSYLPQVKQSSTVDPSKIPNESQLNIQISSQKVLLDKEIKDVQEISNESEENKCHVAVIAQPTQIVCDQAAFQTPGEASDDEIMDQTQHVPMKTIETVHQYPNTEKTSTDKPTVVDTKQEISQVSNEDRNTVFLLETQEVSHLLVEDITPTETRQMPQAEDQHSLTGPQQTLQQTDVRSGDTCNTEGKQQLLNKNSDEFRVTHCILNENANQPIKIHRMPPDVDQTLVKTLEEVSDDEIIDQTQHVMMENKETLHQYPKTEEVSTEISQIPNEGRNTALLFETQKLSHLLVEDITPTETGQMPQAKVQQILQNSQQVSTEKETPLQTSLGAQVPNQNAREPLVKLDEAKEVTHEIQHIVTEDEEQDYTLTEPRHVMQQTLTDTQVSVGAQQNTEPILYLPQVKQSSTVDPLKIPNESQLNTQISSQRILDNELKTIQDVSNQLEEESKYQVTVIDQQTPSVSDQAAFQTPGEASDDDDEIMDQTQHVPMKTIETVHQYPNTEKTSTDKPTVVDTKQEISQVPNDDINMVLLLETQKVSHILVEDITPTETRLIPQAEDQHSLTGPQRTLQETDARSGDIHNTETTQQLLNKDSDEFQITHCILNENVNQPIKIPPQTLQEVTQHLSLDTEHCEQTVVELQPRLHNQHMVEVSHQFIDDNDTVVMMETHHCIKSIDAPVMSHDASATHQRGILQATQQTSHDQVLHQTQLDCEHISHQCSSETQQTPDSSPTQPVVHSSPHNTEQTSAVTDQPVQIDEHPCVEVEMSHTSNEFGKVSNQQSLKTTQELNKPQSATIHEVLINTTATSVHHVAQHPPNEACRVSIESEQMSQEASVVETYHTLNEPQMKFSKTQESSDKVAKQIIHQLVESDNAHITTNIQGSSHNGVKDDQRSLTIHSTLDRVYTTVCQLPPMSVLEPQKTSQQQHLQSISLEKSEQLQTEASLDEANEHIDQPVTLETQQEISPSSQQALFESTKGTYHNLLETQPTLNLIEPSQLLIDVQEQTQQIQSQQISYQLPEGAEEYQKPFETECTSIKTPEMLIQIPVGGTTPQSPPETMCSHSDDNRQEVSSDSHQEIISTEPQEVPLLRINDDTKEVTDVPTKTKGVEHCFTFNNNQTPNKVPPFSVEIHKLSIEDDCISYQPLPKTQPVLKEAHLETCSLLMEQRSVLHEISIDYREKMVETRKTFYRTSTLDDPHTFEHLFSIEAKQPLPEQLQPQQISPKTKEITHRVLDEPRSTLAESGHLEKEQILVEPQPNPLVSNNKEVVRTVEISAEDKTQQIPIDTVTTQKLVERSPEAKKHINPVVVEYDEDVMIIEFTNGDQVTKHNFVIVPSYHVSHHYHLYADEYITPIGKEISTCTIRCCSYHILVKIEKVSQKKKPYAVPVSTPWHQNDLQSTRKAIDELLLKYL